LSAAKEAELNLLIPDTYGWVVSKTYDLTKKIIREIHKDMVRKHRMKPVVEEL
jgi:hypothetical protein